MISTKKLAKMEKKWPHLTGTSKKGHFVVYKTDSKRFTIPLSYLSVNIFLELLRVSEEEFGLLSEGPIRMPCDSVSFKYVMFLVQKGLTQRLNKDDINALVADFCSSGSCSQDGILEQRLLICSS